MYIWHIYCDSFTKTGCRKNKLGTGEDTSKRMRRSQNIFIKLV